MLRAGPIRAAFHDGALCHLRLGTVEVAERIYAAVRDRDWGTTPGRIENLSVDVRPTDFRVVFDSVHKEDGIDFRWRGTIEGTPPGTIVFAMDGKAQSAFLRNRIGLCVHHPLRGCAGKPCLIETADGRVERSEFPEFVAPHQPFRNIRAMKHEVAGVRVEMRFEGDVFETEDHRNWTDANFKTYSTPLSLPFPVEVAAGAEVRQRVEITVHAAQIVPEPAPDRAVRVRAAGSALPMPRIGLAMAPNEPPLSNAGRTALRRLRLAHLRVESGSGLERAAEEAQALGLKLEIAVTLPGDLRGLSRWSPMADRWLVFPEHQNAAGSTAALALRQAIGPDAVAVVGTNAYFAELNRNRPEGDGWDAACFSINPQVHMFDDESVMANAAAQYDVVRCARRFPGGRAVVVSPVTLRPRFNPYATTGAVRPPPDPRQKLPFCAAWTVASLKALAEAGASSVTYFETHGAGGVMDGGDPYPVYRVFEALGDSFIPCEISDLSRVAAMAFDAEAGRRYLIANLTPEVCEIEVEHRAVVLEPYGVAIAVIAPGGKE
jgi:hypothetical protein